MRHTEIEQKILSQAIVAFEAETSLHAQGELVTGDAAMYDAHLDILFEDRHLRFSAEIRNVDRFQTLGAVKAILERAPYLPLLVAPYISEAIAKECRALHLPFIDGAGNAYLEAPGLFVYVTGKRRPPQAVSAPDFRALTPSGLRVIFALLNVPELANAPYREIASTAQVALGTVGWTLSDLEERGLLTSGRAGSRRLLALDHLQDDWITHYPIKLRPKLHARRFTASDRDWWKNVDISQHHAYWGGEIAAAKLTGYLKPEQITIYMDGNENALVLAHRLRPSINGEIEILNTFWDSHKLHLRNDLVPPLLVYADLMATTDSRNIETAKLIHEQYFK